MTTTTAPNQLPLSPPVNLRDLGGIATATGTTRAGFAIRADDLSIIDEKTASDLVSDGLSAVIDLRSKAEVAVTGRGKLSALPVSYHHVPFMAQINDATDSTRNDNGQWDQANFGEMYIHIFEGAAPQIVASLAIIAHSPGAVAFHCAAGQDRTGVLAAATLLTLGVCEDEIVNDYTQTGQNSDKIRIRIRPVIQPLMEEMGLSLEGAASAALREDFSEAPMRKLLHHLKNSYNDPLTPLYRAGLNRGLVDRLHERAHS